MKENLYAVRQGGASQAMSDERLAKLQEIITDIVGEGRRGLWSSRMDNEDTRLCRWDNQSSDGRKWTASDAAEPVLPFDGACDNRVRLTDMLVNEDVMLSVVATLRSIRRVIVGMEQSDAHKAAAMNLALEHCLRNTNFMRSIITLANYTYGDSPAVAMMYVGWRQEQGLELYTLTLEELMAAYVQLVAQGTSGGGAPELQGAEVQAAQQAAQEFQMLLQDSAAGDDTLSALLRSMFGQLTEARARKAVRELREKGSAQVPMPYLRNNGLDLRPLRMFEDVYMRTNVMDFQRCQEWFRPEWLTETELKERSVSDGWTDDFITDVLQQEATPAFPEYIRQSGTESLIARNSDHYKGLYQVVHSYVQAVNEDNIPGRYVSTIHLNSKTTAYGMRLLDYKHGKWPGVIFSREALTSRIMDSRGIPEMQGPMQSFVKDLVDGSGNNAKLSFTPPIITWGRKGAGDLYIAPIAELQAPRTGTEGYKWLPPPQFSQGTQWIFQEIRQQLNEFHGRPAKEVDPTLVALHRQYKTSWWLAQMRDVWTMAMQNIQQYMSDEDLQRVTNLQGITMIRSREEIQGQFDIQVGYDPEDLSTEHLESQGTILRDIILAMDREKVVDTTPAVQDLFYRMNPSMASVSIRTRERAMQAELESEMEAYQQVRSGVEPDLPDDGSINYEARLGMYETIQKMNPEAFADMSPDKQKILQSRIQRMTVLAQQYGENVQIGREGGRRALGEGGAAAVGPGAPAGQAGGGQSGQAGGQEVGL